MKGFKQPTVTSIVLAALVKADDFRTGKMLQQETGLSGNRVSAALYHMQKHKAAEFIEAGQTLWWFATPTEDTRTFRIEEKHPEIKPRKPRKPKASKVIT